MMESTRRGWQKAEWPSEVSCNSKYGVASAVIAAEVHLLGELEIKLVRWGEVWTDRSQTFLEWIGQLPRSSSSFVGTAWEQS